MVVNLSGEGHCFRNQRNKKGQENCKTAPGRRYDPGPGVSNHSNYSLLFYSDMTIGDSKNSPRETASRNKWRNFEAVEDCGNVEVDWNSSSSQQKKKKKM